MDIKLLKVGSTYTGKYGADRTITRMSKTHLYYTTATEGETKTRNESFAKWGNCAIPVLKE